MEHWNYCNEDYVIQIAFNQWCNCAWIIIKLWLNWLLSNDIDDKICFLHYLTFKQHKKLQALLVFSAPRQHIRSWRKLSKFFYYFTPQTCIWQSYIIVVINMTPTLIDIIGKYGRLDSKLSVEDWKPCKMQISLKMCSRVQIEI